MTAIRAQRTVKKSVSGRILGVLWFAGLLFYVGYVYQRPTVDYQDVQFTAWVVAAWIGFVALARRLTEQQWRLETANNAVMFAVVAFILSDAMQLIPDILTITPKTAMRAILYVVVFLISLQFGYAMPASGIAERWQPNERMNDPLIYWRYTVVAFTLALVSYLYFTNWSIVQLVRELNLGRFDRSWSRGAFGDVTIFVRSLSFLRITVPVAAGAYIVASRQESLRYLRRLIVLLMALAVIIFEFYQGDRRVFLFVAAAPFLIPVVVYTSQRARALAYGLLIAGAVAITVLSNVQMFSRGNFASALTEHRDFTLDRATERFYADYNLVHFGRITDLVPDFYEYIYFDELIYIVTLPIPRFLWPGKPIGFGYQYVDWIRHTSSSSVSYSALAEMYVSFGVAGIIFGGILLGIVCANIDQLREKASKSMLAAIMFCLGALTLVLGMRSLREIAIFGVYVVMFQLGVRLASGMWRNVQERSARRVQTRRRMAQGAVPADVPVKPTPRRAGGR